MIEPTSGITPPRQLTLIQGGASRPSAARPVQAASGPQTDHYDGGIPATPPPEVLQALDRAAAVMHELSRRNVALHFEVDETTKKIRVQVLDGDGHVLREIPATRVLDVLSGGGQGLAFSAVG